MHLKENSTYDTIKILRSNIAIKHNKFKILWQPFTKIIPQTVSGDNFKFPQTQSKINNETNRKRKKKINKKRERERQR